MITILNFKDELDKLALADGPKSYAVSAGMTVIVPRGTWHRFHSPEGVSLVTATPKPTEHLTVDVDDPRALTAAQRSNTIEEKWR